MQADPTSPGEPKVLLRHGNRLVARRLSCTHFLRLFIGKKQELKQKLGLKRSVSLRQHKACSPSAILLVPKGLHRKAAAPCHVWIPCPDNDLPEQYPGTTARHWRVTDTATTPFPGVTPRSDTTMWRVVLRAPRGPVASLRRQALRSAVPEQAQTWLAGRCQGRCGVFSRRIIEERRILDMSNARIGPAPTQRAS